DCVREARHAHERRPADGQRDLVGRRDREQRLVTPDRLRPRRDRLARHGAALLVPVVDGIERTEAPGADPDRVQVVLRLTDATTESCCGHYTFSFRPSLGIHSGLGTLLARAGCRGVFGPVPSASLDAERDAVPDSLSPLYKTKLTAGRLPRTPTRRTSRSARAHPAHSAARAARRLPTLSPVRHRTATRAARGTRRRARSCRRRARPQADRRAPPPARCARPSGRASRPRSGRP